MPNIRTISEFAKSMVTDFTLAESAVEVAKVQNALDFLSADVGRGNGSVMSGNLAAEDYWLGVVWAIASLGWESGKQLARSWSATAIERYTEDGFETAWHSYKSGPNNVTIRSLYKLANIKGWQYTPPVAQEDQISRYKLLTSAELNTSQESCYALKGIFPQKGLGAIYGPSSSGKSFLAFDMATAVASGSPWFGIRVTKTPVVYVVLEGESGLKKRVQAWEKDRNVAIPDQMFLVLQEFSLTSLKDVQDLAAVVPTGSLIVIDTLNRAAPTIDENSSADMGLVLQNAKLLQHAVCGLVVLIHHTGKDLTRGARGHSSFFAALDGAVEVQKNLGGRLWRVAKSKDGTDDVEQAFDLNVVDLGYDSDGDPITSCTIKRCQGQLFQKPQPSGKNQIAAIAVAEKLIAVSRVFGVAGAGPLSACVPVEELIQHIANICLATVAPNKRNNSARTLVRNLCDGGYLKSGLESGTGWIWMG
jgi:hypothetical protein